MPARERRFLSLPPEIWKEIDKEVDNTFGKGGHNFIIYKILKSHYFKDDKKKSDNWGELLNSKK